ncbi:MAG: DUF4179 domain-containing protein [Clostridia bacterium]|nr:DUF4179 domain-containing protein [Clostridia bacterium]
MNRKEEYWDLVSELDDTPPALDTAVEQAKARRKKTRAGKWFGIPVATLGGIATAFVLLVNTSIPFALACARVPFLKELTAAVAFSETLRAAVENDYVQYVGQSQTENGITLTVHYLILDPSQLNVFYTIEGGDAEAYEVAPGAVGLGGYSYGWHDYMQGQGMGLINLSTVPAQGLPEQLQLAVKLFDKAPQSTPVSAPEQIGSSVFEPGEYQEPEPEAQFSFSLPIDPRFTGIAEQLTVNQWIELNGQRILIDRLDVYPLSSALRLGDDDTNTAWLKSMHFYLEDEKGNRYEQGNLSLFASGEEDSPAFLTYYLESAYFKDAKSLTLHITDADWLDKDKHYTNVDLVTGTADFLPQGVSIQSVERSGADVHLTVRYPKLSSLFGRTHYDPEGGEYYRSYGSSSSDERGYTDYITLEDYPWDTVRMELDYTRTTRFETPILVTLK